MALAAAKRLARLPRDASINGGLADLVESHHLHARHALAILAEPFSSHSQRWA